MFLNVMEVEERKKFLELAFKLAQIDGDYAEEEEEIINSYKAELGITEIEDTLSIDELISYFSSKNDTVKKVVLFEVYGMILADDKLEKSEEEVFDNIKSQFNISADVVEQIVSVADELQNVYDKLYDVLG
jgi:uncharacterized tellurite resistance protein B-like protein